jgi:hypothetical protein
MSVADDFIATRAAQVLALRQEHEAAAAAATNASRRRWWWVGWVMLSLGLLNGIGWWVFANISGFDPLPRLLG